MDKYTTSFMAMACIIASHSSAVKKKVGCVIIKDNRPLSMGYNGTPHGTDNVCEDETGHTFDYVLHAEQNALLNLVREGISTIGATMIVTLAPCIRCAAAAVQVGIKEIYYLEDWKGNKGVEWLKSIGFKIEKI